jgi:hypothetical protein
MNVKPKTNENNHETGDIKPEAVVLLDYHGCSNSMLLIWGFNLIIETQISEVICEKSQYVSVKLSIIRSMFSLHVHAIKISQTSNYKSVHLSIQ